MENKNNRYAILERTMTISLGIVQILFILYMIGAGFAIDWLKSVCAVLTIMIALCCFAYLYITGEFRKRRSLWMSLWAAALVICTIASLILQFPSPHPGK